MLQGILRQMGLNHSFFMHFIIFSGVLIFLKLFFFQPILRYLHKRDEKTTLLAQQIRELTAKCDQRTSEYNAHRHKIQREYAELMDQYTRQAHTAYYELVFRGRTQALEKLSKHREKLRKDYEDLGQELVLSLNDVKKSLSAHLC